MPEQVVRIHAVTPIHVDAHELARRQARYDALAPGGLTVRLHDIGPDGPPALDTEQQIRDSEGLVLAALVAAPDDVDAVMPDCVLDPGVPQFLADGERPVIGLLRSSLGWTAILGRRAGAVTRNEAIADELSRQAEVYGYGDVLTDVEVLHLDVDAIHKSDRWAAALEPATRMAAANGATHLVNGCSAVDLPAAAASWPARVIDPTGLALRLVAAGGVT